MKRQDRARQTAGMSARTRLGLVVGAAMVVGWLPPLADGEDVGTDAPPWTVLQTDCGARLISQDRGQGSEFGLHYQRITWAAGHGTLVWIGRPLTPLVPVQELRLQIEARGPSPGLRLGLLVRLPRSLDAAGRERTVMVWGETARRSEQWQTLVLDDVPKRLTRAITTLRAERLYLGETTVGSGLPDFDATGAYADRIVLSIHNGPGTHEVEVNNLSIRGLVPRGPTADGDAPAVSDDVGAGAEERGSRAGPVVRLERGRIEVNGKPIFLRGIEHQGEPLEDLAELGFNVVVMTRPPTAADLDAAHRVGLYLIAPPPRSGPSLLDSGRPVVAWLRLPSPPEPDDASRQASQPLDPFAEAPSFEVSASLPPGVIERPWLRSADGVGARLPGRNDLVAIPLGPIKPDWSAATALTALAASQRQLGSDVCRVAVVPTEADPRIVEQIAGLTGQPNLQRPLPFGVVRGLAMGAALSGVRGILYTSRHRLDRPDPAARARRLAFRAINAEFEVLTPWLASGTVSPPRRTTARDDGPVPTPGSRESSRGQAAGLKVAATPRREVVTVEIVHGRSTLVGLVSSNPPGGEDPSSGGEPAEPIRWPTQSLGTDAPAALKAFELADGRRIAHLRYPDGAISGLPDVADGHPAVVVLTADPAVTSYLDRSLRVRGEAWQRDRYELLGLRLADLERSARRLDSGDGMLIAAAQNARRVWESLADPTGFGATSPPHGAMAVWSRVSEPAPTTAPSSGNGLVLAAETLAGSRGPSMRHLDRQLDHLAVTLAVPVRRAVGSRVTTPLLADVVDWPDAVALRLRSAATTSPVPGGGLDDLAEAVAAGWTCQTDRVAEAVGEITLEERAARSGRRGLSLRVVGRPPGGTERSTVPEFPLATVTTPLCPAPAGSVVRWTFWVRDATNQAPPASTSGPTARLTLTDSETGTAWSDTVPVTPHWRKVTVERAVGTRPPSLTLTLIDGAVDVDDVAWEVLSRPGKAEPDAEPTDRFRFRGGAVRADDGVRTDAAATQTSRF